MQAFRDIFSSNAGLMSAAGIAIMLGMGVFYIGYFIKHVREDAARFDASQEKR